MLTHAISPVDNSNPLNLDKVYHKDGPRWQQLSQSMEVYVVSFYIRSIQSTNSLTTTKNAPLLQTRRSVEYVVSGIGTCRCGFVRTLGIWYFYGRPITRSVNEDQHIFNYGSLPSKHKKWPIGQHEDAVGILYGELYGTTRGCQSYCLQVKYFQPTATAQNIFQVKAPEFDFHTLVSDSSLNASIPTSYRTT
jgi:hypothetical protein